MPLLKLKSIPTNTVHLDCSEFIFVREDENYNYYTDQSKAIVLRIIKSQTSSFVTPVVKSTFGEFLRETLKERNLSQHDLADMMNGAISQMTLSNIIRGGINDINTTTIIPILRALGFPEQEYISKLFD